MDMRNTTGRFVNYTLQGNGENLSPAEQQLREKFLSKDNKDSVFGMVQRSVDPMVTYGNVVDSMFETFEGSLYLVVDTVEQLNELFIKRFQERRKASLEATARSRQRGFVRSNIPEHILPRASFSVQDESHDKIVEFQFR